MGILPDVLFPIMLQSRLSCVVILVPAGTPHGAVIAGPSGRFQIRADTHHHGQGFTGNHYETGCKIYN